MRPDRSKQVLVHTITPLTGWVLYWALVSQSHLSEDDWNIDLQWSSQLSRNFNSKCFLPEPLLSSFSQRIIEKWKHLRRRGRGYWRDARSRSSVVYSVKFVKNSMTFYTRECKNKVARSKTFMTLPWTAYSSNNLVLKIGLWKVCLSYLEFESCHTNYRNYLNFKVKGSKKRNYTKNKRTLVPCTLLENIMMK